MSTSSNNKGRVRFFIPRPANGGTSLAAALGVLRVRRGSSTFVARSTDTLINWGSSSVPEHLYNANIINKPANVEIAVDKRRALHRLQTAGVPHLVHTTEARVARNMLLDGATIMVRETVNGHSGQGIIVLDRADMEVPEAPLYTQYFKGREEYRVHVVRGEVVDVQQKKTREGVEANYFVRSYDNGWVFCRDDIEIHEAVLGAAVDAVVALGLDFGAVDIKRNETNGNVAVLEVNTAPALTGSTLEKYTEVFQKLLEAA